MKKFLHFLLFFMGCSWVIAQAPTTSDCLGALPICQSVITQSTPGTDGGNYTNEINIGQTCLSSEDNSTWYTFTASENGMLNFVITPDNLNDDYDWALFDITGASCEEIATNTAGLLVSCNAAGGGTCNGLTGADGSSTSNYQAGGCAGGNTAFNAEIPMQVGNTYTLMVSNWSGSTDGYTIDFSASTGLGILDDIDPFVEDVQFPETCEETQIIVNFSEYIQCSTINSFNFQLTGTGGPYSLVLTSDGCDSGGTQDEFFALNVSPPLEGVGNYTLSLITDGVSQVLDLCGNPAASWSGNFSTNNELTQAPSLTPPWVQVCQGDEVIITPSGNNNISGGSFNFYGDSGLNSLLWMGGSYSFTTTMNASVWVTETHGFCVSPATEFMIVTEAIPPAPLAIDPTPVCQDATSVDFIANGTGGALTWYLGDPASGGVEVGQGNIYTIPLNNAQPGFLSFWVTEMSNFGCESEAVEVTLEIVPTPDPPLSNPFVQICEGDDIPTLMADGIGDVFTWYVGDPLNGGVPVATGNTFNPDISVSEPGDIYFYVTQTNSYGCESEGNLITLAIEPLPVLESELIICADDALSWSIELTINHANNIATSSGDIDDDGNGNFVVTNIEIGEDLVIFAENTSTDCSSIFEFFAPDCGCPYIEPPISDGDVMICEGDDFPVLEIAVLDGQSANWYDAATDGNLLASDTVSYQTTSLGVYYVEAENAGCVSDRIAIEVIQNPLPIVLDTVLLCADDLSSYAIEMNTENANNVISNIGTASISDLGLVVIENIPVGEQVEVTLIDDLTGCEAIWVLPIPDCSCPGVNQPSSLGDVQYCEGDNVPSVAVTVADGLLVNWYDALEGGNLLIGNTDEYQPPSAGVYYAEAYDGVNDCASGRVAVEVIENTLPLLIDTMRECAIDLLTYEVVLMFDVSGTIAVSEGDVQSDGNGVFVVSAIDVANDLTITMQDSLTACSDEFVIAAPDCSCDEVQPPVSDGDVQICEGASLEELVVAVGLGETVDWYDAPVGGNLLAEGQTNFTPPSVGVYYAEARVLDNGCLSDTRTAVEIMALSLPTLVSVEPDCAFDLLSYSLVITIADGDSLSVDAGDLSVLSDSTFLVENVAIANTLMINVFNTATSCSDVFAFEPPDCDCLDVEAPQSAGDVVICEGDDIPSLSVVVGVGETVDWYDDVVGGNLLLAGSDTYLPTMAGSYYAETRVLANDCVSNNRTEVVFAINDLPILLGTMITCAPSLLTYDVEVVLGQGDSLVVSQGVVTSLGLGVFVVADIAVDDNLVIEGINSSTSCMTTFEIEAPTCPCPSIEVPTSSGDAAICFGDDFPELSVVVGDGETANWYDAPSGGNLLLENSLSFTPAQSGVYYVEAIALVSGCVSDDRVAIQMQVDDLPMLSVINQTLASCGLSDGTVEVVVDNGEGVTYIYNGVVQGSGGFSDLPVGEATFVVTDTNGCMSSITTEIEAEAPPTALVATPAVLTCDVTTVVLDATASIGVGDLSYVWLYEGEVIGSNATQNVMLPGEYTIQVTQDGCMTTGVVTVEQNLSENLEAQIINELPLDCNVESTLLNGSSSSSGDQISYQWLFEGEEIVGATSDSYNANTAGQYTLIVTDNETGCSVQDNLVLEDNESYPLANAGADQELNCLTTEVLLDGGGSQGGSTIIYQWFDADMNPIDGAQATTLSAALPGVYILQVTDQANGCFNVDQVTVTENYDYPTVNAGTDIVMDCDQTTATLNATASGGDLVYTWETADGVIINGSAGLSPQIAGVGTYVFTALNPTNGCESSDDVLITQLQELQTTIEVEHQDITCLGQNDGWLSLTATDTDVPVLYAINDEPFVTTNIYSQLSAGVYDVVAEDDKGCQWETTITINEGLDLTVDLGEDIYVHMGDEVSLHAQTNASGVNLINWNNSDLLVCDTCLLTNTLPLLESGRFGVQITSEKGCVATDEVMVFVDRTPRIFIPNAFSPNSDGINDYFYVEAASDVRLVNSINVFSRWGEPVFSAANVLPNTSAGGWDGKHRGKKVNGGVYVYIIEVELIDGRIEQYSGDVMLMR